MEEYLAGFEFIKRELCFELLKKSNSYEFEHRYESFVSFPRFLICYLWSNLVNGKNNW